MEGKDAIPIRSWRDGGGRRLAPGGGKFWTYSAFARRMSLIFWLVRSVILVCGFFCFFLFRVGFVSPGLVDGWVDGWTVLIQSPVAQ